jgi:hypothetical protein
MWNLLCRLTWSGGSSVKLEVVVALSNVELVMSLNLGLC